MTIKSTIIGADILLAVVKPQPELKLGVSLIVLAAATFLGVSAASKLDAWSFWASSSAALFRRGPFRRVVTFGLPILEIFTAVALIVKPTFGLALGAALFMVLSIGVAALSITRKGFSCGCFGDQTGEITVGLAIRNGLIALTLAVSAAFLRTQPEARPVVDRSFVAAALWAWLVASTTGVLILQFLSVRSQARLWEEDSSE